MPCKGNILVVDDTLATLRLLVDMLVNQGYDVRPAPNGALALRAAQSTAPDLILLDIKMPGMDGYTVCEKLKANPQTEDIPVIFISALNEVLDKVKAFSVGAVDYITKPFQLEEVLARIQTHLTLRQLQKRLQTAAAAEERNRLARELHDSVTQSLYSSTLFIEASRELVLANDPKNALHYLTRTGEVVQQALKEMRLLVYQLRPPVLKEKGLIGSLQQRLDTVEKRAGVEGRLLMDDLIELPLEVEEHLYWIAQEALNNSLKHAEAKKVKVYLRVSGNKIMLEIADDGQGFNPHLLNDQGGLGLLTMQERAEEIGGFFMIESEPGQGTSVKVSLEVS